MCLGRACGQPIGITRFARVVAERQLNRVLCKGRVDMFTNAELPPEALYDRPQPPSATTAWSPCVLEAVSIVVRSAVRLQVGILGQTTTLRAAGVKGDPSF